LKVNEPIVWSQNTAQEEIVVTTVKYAKAAFVLMVIAIAWMLTACSSQASNLSGGETVPHLDALVRAASAGITPDIVKLMQFSSLPCTKAEGLGGPPKCLADEAEGTLVEVMPVLVPEGHHIRRSEFSAWPGIGKAQLYAAYKIPEDAYSDEYFPVGEYGIAFLLADQANVAVFQVTEAGIVRLDYHTIPSMEEVLKASQVVVRPTPTPE